MGDVVRFKKPGTQEKHKGKMLCRSGFHKWVVDKSKPFSVKAGKLLTVYRCQRCGATKTKAE
ncbi:MAG: hypothetical protein P8Z75_05870 [Gammaproteobacteria bacterium]|jgi:hypothetical protein